MGGVDGLVDQTRSIERVVTALGLDNVAFEGSESWMIQRLFSSKLNKVLSS